MDKGQKLKKLIQSRRGIIFDFDGLLVDSEPFHYKAYNSVFQEYGHTINQDEYWIEFTSKGNGAQGEIDRHELKGFDSNKIRKKKFIVYSEFCRNGDICFFPLAERLIRSAELAGYKLAIASGSRNDDIRTILDLNGYGNTFHLVLGKESAQREKPAPDIFIKTAEILGIEPDKLVVLEDAEKGLIASKEAGIPCVIVRNKLNQNLEFQDADFVCENLEEVVEAIEDTERQGRNQMGCRPI